MTDKTPAMKMHVKDGMSVSVLHAPRGLERALGIPAAATLAPDPAEADVVIAFAANQAELEERLPALVTRVRPTSRIWVCYPKGSRAAGHDISRDTIWPFAEALGLRPIAMVSIDETWSGFGLRAGG